MNRLIVLTLCVLCMCATAKADVTAWIWGDVDFATETNMAGARIGYIGENSIEIGVTAQCYAERKRNEVFGAYILLHLDEVVVIPNPLPFGPETVSAAPYGGFQYLWDQHFDNSLSGPVAGFKFMEVFAIEYRYQLLEGTTERWGQDEHSVILAARMQF